MDEDVTSVHITKGLTSSTILDLIEEYPNLEEITCCPSIFNRISKNYIDALNQLDITVSKKYNWGAKPKYSSLEEDILNLAKEGKKAKVGTLGKLMMAFMGFALISTLWSDTKFSTLSTAALWWTPGIDSTGTASWCASRTASRRCIRACRRDGRRCSCKYIGRAKTGC